MSMELLVGLPAGATADGVKLSAQAKQLGFGLSFNGPFSLDSADGFQPGKLAGFEAYAPTDNVSELTARTNDEGWDSVFLAWLKGSRLRKEDAVFVMSVGGGSLEPSISPNLVRALQYAREADAAIVGIVGRDGGYTATVADACVIVPTVNPETVTPQAEAFQAVIWHLLVSHPKLKANPTKWEATGTKVPEVREVPRVPNVPEGGPGA